MKLLLNVKTSQLTEIMAYDTEMEVMGERLYCLYTNAKGIEHVQFGNKGQIMSMLIPLRTIISEDTREAYDTYMSSYFKNWNK